MPSIFNILSLVKTRDRLLNTAVGTTFDIPNPLPQFVCFTYGHTGNYYSTLHYCNNGENSMTNLFKTTKLGLDYSDI